ncbi:MAG: ABC transporter ATP-binding protein [Verrucomicrobia bacterium]|nr:ABC transporter ATP-binding protein [Verrucomicrobiota bacterium]
MPHHAVFSVAEDVTHARARSAGEMFRRIAAYLKRYPWFALGTMSCAMLTTLLGLAYPKLTQLIIDRVIVQHQEHLLGWYVAALVCAFVFRDFFNGLRIQLNNTFEQRVIFDMRRDLYDKLQHLPVGYFDQRATGDIMTRVMDDVTALERILIDGAEQGTVAVLSVFGVMTMLFWFNAELAWLAMTPLPFLALGALIYTRTAHARYRIQRRAMSAMNALLHDNLQGIRQIKLFARELHELTRFERHAGDVRASTLSVMRVWSVYSPSMSCVAALGAALILYFGGIKVLQGEMTLGQLVGFLGYLVMFYDPVGRLHHLNQMFQAARAAGERIFDILDAPSEATERIHTRLFGGRVAGDVRFEDVHFEYVRHRPVLREISFHAAPGQTVALVGPTGAGKSTIIHLLSRFHDVGQGRVLVDERDVRDATLGSLRAQMGVVSQEPFLFNGTIRENILYGRLDASESDLMSAATAANAHEFVARLPKGYDSRVGERGVKLSVGEKQRISIARALLKNPPILLLDEATASVDTATEGLIQEALARLMRGRTCLMIAHRLSTVRHAGLILVLEQGRIIERGSHAELLKQGGLYARLCQIQAPGTIEEKIAELQQAAPRPGPTKNPA